MSQATELMAASRAPHTRIVGAVSAAHFVSHYYILLLAPLLDEPDFAGFFVWREYADPDDTSQEPPWGFSPRGKLAELVVRDAFAARWACDPWWRPEGPGA